MLKNDRMKDKERKKEVEGLLGSLADERFALLVNLGKKISDWGQEERKESKLPGFVIAVYNLQGLLNQLCLQNVTIILK